MNNLNYGVIGNCRTAALISQNGNIEWLCFPDFDSPSIFASMLDREKGGAFGFEVSGDYRITQNYVPHTNILSTQFSSDEGEFVVLDLTESIFGDILEEDEMEEEEIVTRQDGSMLVEASMNIDDFMEEMGILSYEDLESEDFTTLGGLAMFLIGRIPKAGDIFTYKNLQFEVVDMDRGRVDKLLVIKRDEEQE